MSKKARAFSIIVVAMLLLVGGVVLLLGAGLVAWIASEDRDQVRANAISEQAAVEADLRALHDVLAEQRAAVERAEELLEFLQLSRLAGEEARVLSGGQRKLLELGRAMMAEPQIILLDEPAAGVNPSLLDFIIDRIAAINAQGITVLLIEHNMDMIKRLCGRVLVMASGRLLAEGARRVLARRPLWQSGSSLHGQYSYHCRV